MPNSDYDRIAEVIRFLEQNQAQQPDLRMLAGQLGMSPGHLQRLFSRWAGVSPKSFLKCLTVEHAKRQLASGKSVLATALNVGLSGPGRLHDLCVTLEAASPGEIKSGGLGLKIVAGFATTPFGLCMIASSPRGICHLYFMQEADQDQAESEIRKQWHAADLIWDDDHARKLVHQCFYSGEQMPVKSGSLKLYVRGTEFQVLVWRALLAIPAGVYVSYRDVARMIGRPSATRAVGTAVGRNEISYLIPCHRVIRETGVLGHYRWGSERKKSMLVWETADRPREGPLAT